MSEPPRLPCLARRAGAALGAALLALAVLLGRPAAAAPEPAPEPAVFKMRVVGGLAGITQYTQLEAPFWTRDLARLSGGRFTAEIVPFDRAGVPGSEMLRLLRLGVVPFGTVLVSSLAAQHPFYTAADLPGLNPDMATLRANVAALRPALEQALRSEQGIEPLALYVYPAQVLFCRERLRGLADLRGRTVRVSSAAQSDFMAALGAKPRLVPFAQMLQGVQGGALDCAVTAAMSGNALGLHQHTAYLYPMPITWGLAVFGANQAAWQALPAQLRTLLREQLPRLETAVWLSAEEETVRGLACNTGSGDCTSGRRGDMVLVPVSPQDQARRQDILRTAVLPRWLERCGAPCAGLPLGNGRPAATGAARRGSP